uniref:Uncharacterized protein n=1 Tax=Rhizophora mucronata TaxID=61149 RepID=A0A2P2NHU9_RHIMU
MLTILLVFSYRQTNLGFLIILEVRFLVQQLFPFHLWLTTELYLFVFQFFLVL